MAKPTMIDRALSAVGLARRASTDAAASSLTAPAPWLVDFFGAKSAAGITVNEGTALGIPAAYACISLLANLVGSLPAKVIRRTAAGHEDVNEHPVTRLLARTPNEIHSPFEFRRIMQARVGGSGVAYARIIRDGAYRPTALVPLARERVTVLTDHERATLAYRVAPPPNGNGQQAALLTRGDVLQVNALTTDGFVGISPIAVLRESIGIAASQRIAYGSFLGNSPFFNTALSAPAALTKAQVDDFRAQWQGTQGGQGNAGRTPILWGEWKYLDKTAGMSMADAEFLASRSFENEEICRVFGIPPILIGDSKKMSSWGTGIEQINQGFLTYALNPWLINWEQSLGVSLLTEAEQASGLSVSFDRTALMQASLATRAAFARTMREIGALSVNDVRREFGFNDLPDNIGDNYAAPFNNQGGVNTPAPEVAPSTVEPQEQTE